MMTTTSCKTENKAVSKAENTNVSEVENIEVPRKLSFQVIYEKFLDPEEVDDILLNEILEALKMSGNNSYDENTHIVSMKTVIYRDKPIYINSVETMIPSDGKLEITNVENSIISADPEQKYIFTLDENEKDLAICRVPWEDLMEYMDRSFTEEME